MASDPMNLDDLVNGALARAQRRGAMPMPAATIEGSGAAIITGIDNDSRRIGPGMLYCAVVGSTFDGHDFVSVAEQQGAAAVLVERDIDADVAVVTTTSVRNAMPWLASTFWGNPSERIPTVGVTGTNGKTTITTLLGQIATSSGAASTVIGTLSGRRTTPEAPELQRRLAEAAAAGHRLAAVEVSSHALEQGRADAVDFAVGVFTNLSVDHLDYHESMEDYFAAKAKLFDGRCHHAVVVADDEWGERLAARLPDAIVVRRADITIESLNATGSVFEWRGHTVKLPMAGDFNVVNAICAAEAASLVGFDDDQIVFGLSSMERIPGRMDRVPDLPAWAPTVYVDYSHTPDGLRLALAALRPLTSGRLWCVFGAGGDRDVTKRPLMGSAAEQSSDTTIVTSDNPRSEDPNKIIDQIVSGMSNGENVVVEPDRRLAIRRALSDAATGDIVLIAGKGHEVTQTIGDETVPFDDRLVAQEEAYDISKRRKGDN